MIDKCRLAATIAATICLFSIDANATPQLSTATGNYYEVFTFPAGGPKTWDAANTAATGKSFRGFGGYLATIKSADEDQFIDGLRRGLPLSPPEAWVGGRQILPCSPEPDCGWQWVNDEGTIPTVNGGPEYANWLPYQSTFEPNNLNGNEHHLAVGLGNNFGWNDEGALGNIGGYVVEFPGLIANDDTAEATSGVPKSINVISNDMLGSGASVASVTIVSGPTEGGPVPTVGPSPGFLVTYTSPTDFPDESGDTDTFKYKVTDQYGAFAIATVTVKVIADRAVVAPGLNQLIFNQLNNPSPESNNPMSAAYSQVIAGGEVSIECCRVLDWREGAGKRGSYLPVELDLGVALDHPDNANCSEMPYVAPGMAVLRPWQRGVPKTEGIPVPGTTINARKHDLGVCIIEAAVDSRGVVFSAEEAGNVLGFKLDGSVPTLRYRPFTGGVSLFPDEEIDSPYVIPWTAEWDESRSGKRFSDNLMVVNLWHEWLLRPSVLYLLEIAAALRESIDEFRTAPCAIDSGTFLDDLDDYMVRAQWNILKAAIPPFRIFAGQKAVDELDDATRLALLIGPDAPAGDPYDMCPGNPEGLFVGRLMALKFAACSELVHPFDSASSLDGACMIEEDILCELPELPDFPHPASCSAP